MVDFPGQTGVEPYEYRQQHPNDYEAQVSQGPINSHACENLSTTDKGVAYLRRKIRRSIQNIQNGEKLPETTRVNDEWMTYAQDTVLPIPMQPSRDDESLLREVSDAVMGIIFEGDQYSGETRAQYIVSQLKKLKSDPRFIANG